jgi:glycosyltransferase involved in cell wall biosynthesis
MKKYKILIAVLVYNTESKILQLSEEIKKFLGVYAHEHQNEYEIILTVFDDASRDSSLKLLKDHLGDICSIFAADKNQGYGGSVKRAFDYAVELSCDFLCIFPGDLQRKFSDTSRLIDAAVKSDYDVVSGAKNISLIIGSMPLRRKYGNLLIKNLTHLWGEKISDPLAGFKCYRVSTCYRIIWLCQSRFGFDLDFSFWSQYSNLRKGELPCTASYESHTSTIRSTTLQGLRFVARAIMLGCILKPALKVIRYSSIRH